MRLDFEGGLPVRYPSSHTYSGVSIAFKERPMLLVEELSFATVGGVCLLETAH
jgi:hypothetical protein